MLFLVYNTSFDKSILTLKTCLCAIIFLGKKGEKHEKEKAFKKENKKPFDSCVRFTYCFIYFLRVNNLCASCNEK